MAAVQLIKVSDRRKILVPSACREVEKIPEAGAEAGVGLGAGGNSKLAGPQRRLLAALSCSCGPAAAGAASPTGPA